MSAAKRPPAPPPTLAGFTYLDVLGSGGFADVYLYEQHLPRRRVAVKVMLEGRMAGGAAEQFAAEANVMALLSTHPAIVTIYQAGVSDDGRPYLVMEYCPRPNLQVRSRAAAFSVAEALRVGVQVAAAVETAHRAGILHRDIKPANILVTEYNRPALTDFGIATTADAVESSAGMSIPWSPPESFTDQPESGAATDVYALGATVYTLLAGRSPFEQPGGRNGGADLIQRIESQPVPRLERADAPASLQAVLERAMAKRPGDRFESAVAFARALQRVQIELAHSVTPIDILDDAIARQQNVHDLLTQAADDIASGGAAAQASRQQILDAIDDAQAALAAAQATYDSQLKPQLDQLAATLETIGDDMATAKSDLAGLAGASGGASTALTRAQGVTSQIATSLGEAADTFDRVQGALVKAADTGDFDELSALIGADPSVLAAALAEPVRVDRTPVYPVVSFGAGMAPLYTVLSLWVGALLMTVAIRVDVNRRTLDTSAELSPTQKYLGRYGIFALLGLAQSTLVTVGLSLFVQIDPVHPFLFILAGWVASLVFTLIIYTAVVAFGNAGKALSVLLLVIQISGSGGAYPLQLLPQWFQSVSPFLPATHAINAMRAAIAGTYGADYWVSLGLLASFILPALLLGLVLRRPLISFNRGLAEALESTKLM